MPLRRDELRSWVLLVGCLLLSATAAAQHRPVIQVGSSTTRIHCADVQATAHLDSDLLNPDERDSALLHEGTETKGRPVRVSANVVFFNSLLMSLANCLGVVPFLFVRQLSPNITGVCNSIACGVMLACSFDLIHEGEPYGSCWVVVGVLVGMLCVKCSQAYLQKYENIQFEALEGTDARKILLMLGIMAAHAVGEGAGVGVSYSGKSGWSQGLLVTLAIGLHNIPEGLAVSTVLISRGLPLRRTVLWSFLSALPQAIFALPAYLFVEAFTDCLPFALGFAAGCMIWVVFSELLPDALENITPSRVATTATLSATWLEGTRMMLNKIEAGVFQFQSNVAIELLVIATVCFGISFSLAFASHRFQVFSSPFGLGFGSSSQLAVSAVFFCTDVFQLPGLRPSLQSLLLTSIGGAATCVGWHRHLRIPSLLTGEKLSLPIRELKGTCAEGMFSRVLIDPIAARALCGLIGIGILEGLSLGNASGSDIWRALLSTVVFAGIVAAWLPQLQFSSGISALVCGLTTAIPCYLPTITLILDLKFCGWIRMLAVVLNGCLLVNAIQLLRLTTSMKGSAGLQSVRTDVLLNDRPHEKAIFCLARSRWTGMAAGLILQILMKRLSR